MDVGSEKREPCQCGRGGEIIELDLGMGNIQIVCGACGRASPSYPEWDRMQRRESALTARLSSAEAEVERLRKRLAETERILAEEGIESDDEEDAAARRRQQQP